MEVVWVFNYTHVIKDESHNKNKRNKLLARTLEKLKALKISLKILYAFENEDYKRHIWGHFMFYMLKRP